MIDVDRARAITEEALALITGDRNADYGDPADDFAAVIGAYTAFKRGDSRIVTPSDHALYMLCVKLSRIGHRYKRDSGVDTVGYSLILDDLESRENETPTPVKAQEKGYPRGR